MRCTALGMLLACAGGLVACGGGGDGGIGAAASPEPEPMAIAQPASAVAQVDPRGGWVGKSGTRDVLGVFLGNGAYYLLYTQPGDAVNLRGFYQGHARVEGGRFLAPDGRDHAFGQAAVPLDATGAWAPGQIVAARLQAEGAPEVRLNLFFLPDPADMPTLESVAGSYAAQASFAPPGRFSVTPDGLVRGAGDPSVCALGGQLTPRAGEAAFDAMLRFDGPGCAFGGQVFHGAAFLHPTLRTRMYIVVADGARATGLLLVGQR